MSSIFVMDIRVSLSFIRPFNNRMFATIAMPYASSFPSFFLLPTYAQICTKSRENF